MRIIEFLVNVPARNEEVEGRFKGFLGIMEDRVKPVPARGPQGTGRIHKTGKGHRHDLVRGVL